MPLEDDGGSRLAAGGGREGHDQVPGRVLAKLEPVIRGPRSHVLDDRLLVPGRTRDLGQRLEVIPESAGLQAGEGRSPGRSISISARNAAVVALSRVSSLTLQG